MIQYSIQKNEAGQRFDKYLRKLMPAAPSSFLYKMLRKKNIVLNGKKAEGKETLQEGDEVKLFFTQDTFDGFREKGTAASPIPYRRAYQSLTGISVIYENEHMLLLHKPAGILTQKAKETDLSVNEWLVGYLLNSGQITEDALQTFHPSVCNRLDRNTSGLVICAKTLYGAQQLSGLIRDRKVHKYYRMFVKGTIRQKQHITGYLTKDETTNMVSVSQSLNDGSSFIETSYEPIHILHQMTYLEAELLTGKTHQLRAHMASIGHPILMDPKYGDSAFNNRYRSYFKKNGQLLHAYRLEFPPCDILSKEEPHVFYAEEPAGFLQLLNEMTAQKEN